MPDRTLSIEGIRVPRFLYGTAWKEDETRRLTELALRAGLPGHRHRQPAPPLPRGRGRAKPLRRRSSGGLVAREDLFLQTKFTFRTRAGPPPALRSRRPDPGPGRAVVRQLARAPGHRFDRFLRAARAHPSVRPGPGRLGGLAGDGSDPRQRPRPPARRQQRHARTARRPVSGARVRPRFVQNRCYAARGWDRDVRAFCAANGLVYQGFSLLTANREAMAASRAGPHRPAPRPDREPGRLPVRPRRRHDGSDGNHRPRPHAGRPRRLRFPPGSRRGRADRADGPAVTTGSGLPHQADIQKTESIESCPGRTWNA